MEAVLLMEEDSDLEVFGRMARQHHRMMLVYARALLRDEGEARELVQDSLVTAWKNLKRFDVTRDTGAWLRGIVRNKWREHCRKKRKRPEFANGEPGDLEADLSAWETEKEQPMLEALRECRDKLPNAFADAVQVFYYEGLSGAEAAERLGVNAATLRKRLERARSALHDCLNTEL